MSAESVVDGIISNATNLANEKADEASGYASDAQTAAVTVTTLATAPVPTKPSVTIPPYVPNSDAVAEYRGGLQDFINQFGPDLKAKFEAYIAEFFPTIESTLRDATDNWLANMILNGGTGIPAAVEAQIWERDRARLARDSARREDDAVNEWAERGYSLPGGALVGIQEDIAQDLSDKTAQASRDVAIKQIDVQIENTKFAVEHSISLRQIALTAANDYLRCFLQLEATAVQYADGLVDARLKLYDATTGYYNALIGAQRLVYEWGRDQTTSFVAQQQNVVQLTNSNTNARVNAAISAAQAIGSIAASALAAQNTLAHVGNVTNIDGSTTS